MRRFIRLEDQNKAILETIDLLIEVFDKPYKWIWSIKKKKPPIGHGTYKATFWTDKKTVFDVLIKFDKKEITRDFSVTFARIDFGDMDDKSDKITGKGDAFKVFATVIDVTKKFLGAKVFGERKIDVVTVFARMDSKSRVSLYKRIMSKKSGEIGYSIARQKKTNVRGTDAIEFTLLRNDIGAEDKKSLKAYGWV